MILRSGEHVFVHVLLNKIIRINKAQVFTLCSGCSEISGIGKTAILFSVIKELFMGISKSLCHAAAVIFRSVIYQEHLRIYFFNAFGHRFKAVNKILFNVIYRYNYT